MNLYDLDKHLFFIINHSSANTISDILMPAFSKSGYLLFLPYIVYVLWTGYKNPPTNYFGVKGKRRLLTLKLSFLMILVSFASFLLTDWMTNELKHLIQRIRPCHVLDEVRLLVGCSRSYSMPSSHASNSFAFAFSLFYFVRRRLSRFWISYPFIVTIMIAFSRVYVGVHYPSDVVAGIVVGLIISLVVIASYEFALLIYRAKPYKTILTVSLVAISLFRVYYILHGSIDLSPDEAHYWEWSRRLDLSYYSKGPMIAYLIYLGTSIFGDNVFGIRIMAVLFSALSSIFMFKLVNIMYERQKVNTELIAFSSALLLQVIPLFAPFGIIFTIDSPFVFFWILSLYIFWRAVNDINESHRSPLSYWLILGISVGLGLLTKYTMAFFYLCGLLFILFSEKRALLKTVRPYISAFTSIIVFSPVIIWNFKNQWVTIRHTAGQAHVSEGLRVSIFSFLEFIGSQIGIITPIIFFMMFYAIFRLVLLTRENPDEAMQSKFLLYFSLPVICFFILKSIQGKVQANWAMTGYLTGIVAFSKYWIDWNLIRKEEEGRFLEFRKMLMGDRSRTRTLFLIIAGLSISLFITAVSHYPSMLHLSPKIDPTIRLRGWKELGKEVSRIYDALSTQGNTFIFSDRYQVSSELAFYTKGHPKTYCVNLGRRMNQYDLWPDMNSEIKDTGEGTVNAIFVRIGDSKMPQEVASAFERFEKKVFRVYERDRIVREYSIFICYNFKGIQTEKPEKY